jgi:hypothetical protein
MKGVPFQKTCNLACIKIQNLFFMKKKAAFHLSLFLIFLLQFGFYSCQEDPIDPEPADPRTNFLGVWSVNEKWTKLTYEVNITNDPSSSSGIFIENFAASGSGIKTYALVSGNQVEISPLPQTLSNGWIIKSGSGALSGTTKMEWSYVFDDEANTYTAMAVFTKK